MSDDRSKPQASPALASALELVSEMGRHGWVCVPARPTPEMIRAGAAAGGVSLEVAQRIYTAMVRTA